MTSSSPERRASTIIGHLTGQAQNTAETIPLADLKPESNVASLLRERDKNLGLDAVILLQNIISEFFEYNWEKNMSVEEFVAGFHH